MKVNAMFPLKSLARHVQMRPHGDHLLTSSAAFWLFSAGILVFLMATAEAIAWSYLGFLFGDGDTRWIGALLTGATIFLVVWMIDASLITMDRAWREHAAALLGHPSSDRGRTLRVVFTIGVRVVLLLGSLTVTAPYLAQIVFYRDIHKLIDDAAKANIDTTRQAVASTFDVKIAAKSKQVEDTRVALEREVAGKGLSGRYGMGPAAQAMSRSLDTLTEERDNLVAEKAQSIDAYNDMAQGWKLNRDRLAAKYNVDLPQASILENRKALDELRKRPENASTEFAIKAFLAFIFAGLLLLKLFEPISVRLYMSEVLQQEYLRYLAGTFDDFLHPTERSYVTSSSMTPQRLYEFLSTVWRPHRERELEDAATRARAEAAVRNLKEIQVIRDGVGQELKQVAAEYRAALEYADQVRKNQRQLNAAIDILNGDVRSYGHQLAKWTEEERALPLDEESRLERGVVKSQVRQKLAECHHRLEGLVEQLPEVQERVRRAEFEVTRCEERLHEKETELAGVSRKILDLRLATTSAELSPRDSLFDAPLVSRSERTA